MATREQYLSDTLVELADVLVSDFDLLDYADLLVQRSTSLLGGADGGVMVASERGQLQRLASTDERMRLMELFELQAQEGPCIDSFRTGEQVVEPDLARTDRWPEFSRVAVEHGYRSVLALPLRLREQRLGALNVFRAAPGPLPPLDVSAAQAFADMATIGILQDRAVRDAKTLAGQLQAALNSRVVIEQAKGVLAERAGLDMGAAYQALRWHARNHNRHLREVAADVVAGRLTAEALLGSADG